jgi:RimJ/RimL family protein N-acetyltransferase
MGPVTLNGRRLRLRPITPEDYPFLYEFMGSQDVAYRWRHGGAFPPYEAFVQSLQREYNPQYLVTRKDTEERAGWVMSYSVDLRHGFAYMGLIMAPIFVGSGLGLEAAALFLNHLFSSWNLRKVYMEAPDFTVDSLASGLERFFKEEGVLKAHRYYHGRFWDEHILAVYREDWEQLDWEQVAPLFFPRSEQETADVHPRQWWKASPHRVSADDAATT